MPDDNKSSLEHLVKQLMNKKLSKFEQVSDWDSRPLRKSQMHYSAMDAYVLLKIHEVLKGMTNEGYEEDSMTESFQF